MTIIVRVLSIGGLTLLGSSIPWWIGGMPDGLVVFNFMLPVTAINTAIFMPIAGVRMAIRRRRRPHEDRPGAYVSRFKGHLFTWSVLTGFACLTVWVFLSMISSELGLSAAGNVPVALLLMTPTFILGVIASAIVERIYEEVLKKRASRAR